MGAHTAKNVVIALALVGAAGVVVTQRVVPYLAERAVYTDGERTFELDRDDGIRFAVWEAAGSLGGGVNSPARESRPALSPDGRLLVFAVGAPGGNAELYAAEVVDGEPRDARPLARVNSAGDDLAPAFGQGALYFASDREGGQGGFDLYAAPLENGQLGAPAPVGGGINTSADELDPAPLGAPGLETRGGAFGWREALAFASNRGQGGRGDLDLFLAIAGEVAGTVDVVAFPGVNSEFDEREPDLSDDGGALYFASDRGGPERGFDLFRSVLERGEWLAPEPLEGLNTPADERGPSAASNGFELYFSRERAGPGRTASSASGAVPEPRGAVAGELPPLDPGELLRARSRELFRLPSGPTGWLDLLLVGALLLLALLAWLARRWEQLDILYKCFLVSLLLHLLLMWFLREVYPERGEFDLPGGGREPTFRVRVLANRAPAGELAERGGALDLAWKLEQTAPAAPERAALEAVTPETRSAPSAPQRLERETPSEAPDPARRATRVAAVPTPVERAPAPSLRDQEAAAELPRIQAPAPALELAGAAPAATPERTEVERQAPGRLVVTTNGPSPDRAVRLAPGATARLTRERAELAPPQRFELAAATPSAPARSETRIEPPAGPALAMPSEETAAVAAAPAPEAGLPAAAAVAPERSEASSATPGPERAAVPAPAAPALAAARPELAGVTPDLRRRAREASEPQRFRPTEVAPPTRAVPELRGPELALPAAEPAAAAVATPAPSLPLSGPRALASAFERPRDRDPGPEAPPLRRELEGVAPPDLLPRPEPRPLAAARPEPTALPEGPRRTDQAPYRSRFGSEKKTAIQAFGGGADTEAAVARGLAYLARRQARAGNWGRADEYHPKYRQTSVGNSALALLAFLGAGHTHRSGTEYSDNVQRAIDWLLSVQDERTGHFGNSASYSHGISTYALAECLALTGDDALRAPLERAVQQILKNQVPADFPGDERMVGGWGYYYPDGSIYDMWPRVSITSWQVMALESARFGGLEVPDEALDLARDFVVGSWDQRLGAVRYSHDPDRLNSTYPTLPGSTPAGLFVLSLLGEDIASDRFAAPREYLMRRAPDGFRYTTESDFVFRAQGNVYFWYYGSLALLRAGGDEWERWNTALKATLLPAQQQDGSWRPLDVYADYAGDTRQDSIYTTSMCVLTLEVYYRYFTPLLERR